MVSVSSANQGTVTQTGQGSGLDIDAIVEALVDSQTAAKQNQITNQTEQQNAELSAIGTLKSALNEFQASVATLNTSSSFAGLTATSSDEAVVTATAESGATASSYSLTVTSLATSSKVATQYVDEDTSYSSGTLTLSQGDNTYTIQVAEGDSLSDVRDSINAQTSSTGISANIVSDSTGSRLVLSSTTTGADTDISVTASNDSLSSLAIDGTAAYSSDTGGYLTLASDAVYTLDGLSMTSSSNTIDSAVSGMSFTLTGTGSSTVTVGTDTETLTANIESFVEAYNTLIEAINSLTKVTSTTTTDDEGNTTTTTEGGELTGDSTVRALQRSLQNVLGSASNEGGSLQVLSQLGIYTEADGTLSIDSTKLSEGVTTYAGELEGFFTGEDGLLSSVYDAVEPYTKSGGLLDQREDTIDGNLESLQEQQDALDIRIEKLTDMYYDKYNAMDALVASLNTTSDSVMTTLNSMNNSDDD
jgi:flagellar hook-associated protein 2